MSSPRFGESDFDVIMLATCAGVFIGTALHGLVAAIVHALVG